jgi:hypothetical protein
VSAPVPRPIGAPEVLNTLNICFGFKLLNINYQRKDIGFYFRNANLFLKIHFKDGK